MATTFKTLLNSDIANTRTLLHEAIPVTGTIVSGTYDDLNIKTFAHGMYEAVFDYPFLSSSANHIFDISAGYSADSALSASSNVQNAKKINIYNQHAQVLYGYDVNGNVQVFDADGNIAAGGDKMRECFFLNFSRLLTKDEIKKDSFRLSMFESASAPAGFIDGNAALAKTERKELQIIGDYGAATSFKVNSPSGEYGLLFTGSDTSDPENFSVGHIYYQAGIAVITASFFSGAFGDPSSTSDRTQATAERAGTQRAVNNRLTGSTITQLANGLRYNFSNVDFNNTTELNSTIYFCRANTQDYNYSANPTYLNASKIRVKNDNPKAQPVSYITTVGLYSADNELLAVAKLSEPLKKTPSNEITLRVRLDY
tara:strand:- start:1726 stop:2835 length:1110 start_codon:yes stop_codon:yes gene_type:complete